MVSALHAMEWEAEVVGMWAAAKALPMDSRSFVFLIHFMVSTTPSENFGCSFGIQFSSVNLWLRDSTPSATTGLAPILYLLILSFVSGVGESSNAEAATCVCCGYCSLQLGQDHRILDTFFLDGDG
jgi:hypothetical protein